ncbi:MAG: molybdopterin-binding protein, partial [Sulfolobaceae archaeon]
KNLKIIYYTSCIFAIGDELKPFNDVDNSGITDSISPIILTILKKFGEAKYLGVVNDDPKKIEEKLMEAVEFCDIIFTIGGSSVGEHDYVKRVVRNNGELLFEGVTVNVLKRGGVGIINDKPIVILPGQVVSAVTTFHEHGLNVISKMCKIPLRKTIKVKLGTDVEVRHKMDSLYLFVSQGEYVLPLRWGVGLYSEITKADSFGILKRDRVYRKGDEIEVQKLLL